MDRVVITKYIHTHKTRSEIHIDSTSKRIKLSLVRNVKKDQFYTHLFDICIFEIF